MEGPIRVLIADDQEITREGLRAVLATDPGIKVVAEAASGEDALSKMEQAQPNVVLMDVRMPGMNGIGATRLLKGKHPEVAVIILSVYDNDGYVVEAVKAGAAGYLLKDVSRDLLCHTIHAVRWGGTLVRSNGIRDAFHPTGSLGAFAGRAGNSHHPDALSRRELEVLALLVEGNANKEIAKALSIAEDTVKKHVQRVIAKMGVSDRTQAAVKAIRDGIVR